MYLLRDPDDVPVDLYLEMEEGSEEKSEYEYGKLYHGRINSDA
ncbi:MAG: hypothetical protein R2880_14095 [Deinococcales bacterium]